MLGLAHNNNMFFEAKLEGALKEVIFKLRSNNRSLGSG